VEGQKKGTVRWYNGEGEREGGEKGRERIRKVIFLDNK
jgi:hypothetical protein